MKQIIYILSALSLFLLASCEVEDGDYNTSRTFQGKLAFNQVQSHTDDIIYLTEMTGRASLYMTSLAEEKESVAKFYFPQYTLNEDVANKTITISNQISKWIFRHNRKSVNEVDALWSIEVSKKTEKKEFITIIQYDSYALENMGDERWTINISNIPPNLKNILEFDMELSSYMLDLSNWIPFYGKAKILATPAVSQAPHLYNYTIESGEGFNKSNINLLSFQYKAPILYTSNIYNPLRMTEGAVDIQVTVSPQIKDLIYAKLKNSEIEITMGGITEIYNDYYW